MHLEYGNKPGEQQLQVFASKQQAKALYLQTVLPGHMGIVSDPGVAEQIGQPLGHQDPDLFH